MLCELPNQKSEEEDPIVVCCLLKRMNVDMKSELSCVLYNIAYQVRLWRTESSLINGKQGELAGVEQLGNSTGSSQYCIVP